MWHNVASCLPHLLHVVPKKDGEDRSQVGTKKERRAGLLNVFLTCVQEVCLQRMWKLIDKKMVLSLKFKPDFPSHPLWQQPPASSIKPSIVNFVFPGAFVAFLIQHMYPVYWFYVYYLPLLLSFSALRVNILVQISQWCKWISVEVSETFRNRFLKLQGKEIKSVS